MNGQQPFGPEVIKNVAVVFCLSDSGFFVVQLPDNVFAHLNGGRKIIAGKGEMWGNDRKKRYEIRKQNIFANNGAYEL